MRVYISTDLEGVSGIFSPKYMDETTSFYVSARKLLTGDVNAAVAGAFDAGAREVVVRDNHSSGTNLVIEDLDPRAILDCHGGWTGMLDKSFAATLLVGQHAMAGTLKGFLDHTQSSLSWFEYSINGRPLGETGQWATIAGHFGVPLVYLAGDKAACVEAEALIPGIVTTAVKTGVSRSRAVGPHPSRAHEAIRRDVARSLSAKTAKFPKPLVWRKPMTVRLTFYRSDYADARAGGNIRRVDARTIEKKVRSQLDILF